MIGPSSPRIIGPLKTRIETRNSKLVWRVLGEFRFSRFDLKWPDEPMNRLFQHCHGLRDAGPFMNDRLQSVDHPVRVRVLINVSPVNYAGSPLLEKRNG